MAEEHIKINPVPTKVKYSGNGVVREFPTGFAFFEDDNIVVYYNGVIINTGYSVTGVGETDGGVVTFDVAPAEGDKIVIIRKVAIERVTDFQEGGAFRAKNINDELDRQTAFCQQIQEEIDRCVKVQVTDDQDPQELIDEVFEQLETATVTGEAAIAAAEQAKEAATSAQVLSETAKQTIESETQVAIEKIDVHSNSIITTAESYATQAKNYATSAEQQADKITSKITAIDGAVGDIGFAPLGINETENKRRYLNGQVISQSQFVSFTNKIKSAIELYPNIATSETNWQAEVTNSKLGQCGKFVIDDELGTIRLPKVVNIQGLQDLALMGSIKAESLPNITGTFRGRNAYNGNASINESVATGAFGTRDESGTKSGAQASGENSFTWTFNASRSSSTYQDNAPVQQEAIQYPYFIQVATGTEESVDVTREIELNNPFSLLDYKWSEYELSNASWLLSNGAFHSGATYVAVYELLLKLHNGTETKDGVSVKLSTEDYTDTDFVINTADTTFRLPIKVALVGGGSAVVKSYQPTDGYVNKENLANVAIYHKDSGQIAGSSGLAVGGGYLQNMNPTTYGGQALDFALYSDLSQATNNGLKLYFYVGETIQDANVIAASQVLTKVANGIDRTVKSDRATVVGWGMPDYSAVVSMTSGSSAPKNGWAVAHAVNVNVVYSVNGVSVAQGNWQAGGWSGNLNLQIMVSAGDVVTGGGWKFIPCKGAN